MAHRTAQRPQPIETVVMAPPDPRQAPPKPGSDLSLNKVLAAAGAAVTSAVLGSLFGVAGTVLGAAVGSVTLTIATSLYQRSLERARSAVASHVPQVTARLRGGEAPAADLEATEVLPPVAVAADPRTALIAPQVPARRSRRRLLAYVLAAVLGFALALGVVTGAEAIKGSTLVQGQAGTSVGRVLQGGGRTTTPTPTPDDPDDESGSGGPSGTDNQGDNDHHRNRSTSSDPGPGSASATRTPSPSASRSASPTTSAGPSRSGGLLGGLGAAPTAPTPEGE